MKKFILFASFWLMLFYSASGQAPMQRLNIQLQKGVFVDAFQLVLNPKGVMEIDDQDALKIGEGFLSVAGIHAAGTKLAIEERPLPEEDQELSLFVKGYTNGIYDLKLALTEAGNMKADIILLDKYLDRQLTLRAGAELNYAFEMDSAQSKSYGAGRFSLLLKKVSSITPVTAGNGMLAFPNPFNHHLFINVKNNPAVAAEIYIKDLRGKIVWRKGFKNVAQNDILELTCEGLMPGLYLLEWHDQKNKKKLTTLKIIKH